ncbi:Uncharacterised protein [Mycobacteroides abscessus subsp. abscessus]|nr:Uncharacterised protein [Mycobacteroides abscessus subsp. abscessus]
MGAGSAGAALALAARPSPPAAMAADAAIPTRIFIGQGLQM